MDTLLVKYGGKTYECNKYKREDEAQILEIFFIWKASAMLAESTGSKKPQLPASFSERFCCYVCDLIHKPGTGPDAFRLDENGSVNSVIEIKATITGTGFTDVKRDMMFDELIWFSFAEYNDLKYQIYRLHRNDLKEYLEKSGTPRERASVGLNKVVKTLNILPFCTGYIGIVKNEI